MKQESIEREESAYEEAINPYSDDFNIDLFEQRLRQNYTIDHPLEEEFMETNIEISIKHAKIENIKYQKHKQ